ncbi:MAG TPA: hypothetical protein IGR64_18710, partial [Leptolyngbyaceae cyanobacterium M65_K2018_010]|nr:hypothetical protein [Leptolyngbyaceae cyanobacterium M65_K2018_010]
LESVLSSLELAGSWTSSHPLYYEVQPLVEQWSGVVLQAAEQELRRGHLEQAQTLIERIPVSSPIYAEGQAALQAWHAEWEQGTALLATAQTALQQKDWSKASAQVLALAELQNPHWRVDQVQALSRQIRQERQAQDLLQQAVALASPGGSDRLGQAIRTASQIDQTTFTYAAAQTYMDRWSDALLKLGLDQWYASELPAAMTLGRYVALNPNRAKVAQELIWLSRARQLAQQSLGTWRTSPDQLVTLYKAMLLANQVPPDSPFYPQAQSSVATWRTHLGDLGHLQTAQLIGRVNQLEALGLAIAQAEQVPLGHPRRVQAQTLIAHWRQEVERLEDRPYLAKAHQLAQTQTLEGLRAAIASAGQIALHRALRPEAQSWIYVWTSQIQAIEDRPVLNRARNLAERGELSQAIAEAAGIQPGRALYGEARAAMAHWQRQIWAQDQARQRAAQRALAKIQTPTPQEDPLAVEVRPREAATAVVEPTLPADPALAAPAPSPTMPAPSPRRSPQLPTRLETVPGDIPDAAPDLPEPGVRPQPAPGMPVLPPTDLSAPGPVAPPVGVPPGTEPAAIQPRVIPDPPPPAPSLPAPAPGLSPESSHPERDGSIQGKGPELNPRVSVRPALETAPLTRKPALHAEVF